MADFVDGFVYECDVPEEGMLTIEGGEVDGFERAANGVRAKLPHNDEVITAETVVELVKRYLELTGISAARAACRGKHLERLRSSKNAWNKWRREEPTVQPMLANVAAKDEFPDVCLDGYNFSYANLTEAKLSGVSLKGANFHQAILAKTDLSGAHLERANFCRTDLYETNLTGAWLTGANLQGVQLAKTKLAGAHLSECTVYGLSAWDLRDAPAEEDRLRIRYTAATERSLDSEDDKLDGNEVVKELKVDGLDLASFMYLTLNNRNISRIIDAASERWVLILGRFTEGKKILVEIENEMKKLGKIPIIFDFPPPERRDLIETLLLLAGLSAFVVVEMTNPRSTPLEVQVIVPNFGVPVLPLVRGKATVPVMFSGLRKFQWVHTPMNYEDERDLVEKLRAWVEKNQRV